VLTFLGLNGGAVLAALVLAVALGLGGRPSRLLLGSLGGYLVIVHSTVLVAGLGGQLTVSGLALVLGGVLAAALWLVRQMRSDRAGLDVERPDDDPRFTAAALFAPIAAVVCGVLWTWPHLFHATRLWVWDDYTYHMVYPALWLQERTIAAVTPAQAFTMQAWYPLSAGLVSTWFMVPVHGARGEALAWVSLTGLLYAGIVAAGAAELFARLGCRRGAWAVPVVLFATSSRMAVMASSFSDADLAQASALFGALVFAMPRGEAENRRDVVVDTWYAGLLSGIALGVKVSAAPQALIVLLATALRAGMPGEAVSARVRAAARTALVFVVAWAATAGYWYARNVIHTGNPLYPAAFLAWPGATFPETTLLEYGRQYGLRRAVTDALAVYLSWPFLHAVLAVIGLVGLAGWLIVTRSSSTRPRRYFAGGTVSIAAAVLILLPAAPYSAGNAMTFRSGFVHWDSMRYVALLPMLGWMALGFLLDAGAGARRGRTLAAVVITTAAWLTPGNALPGSGVALVVLTLGVVVLARLPLSASTAKLGTVRRRTLAVGVAALVVAGIVAATHGAKATATSAALYREPLFGAAAAVLDRQPAGTRVAVFGDQWIYPAFGDRAHLRPIRLDRDGRVATAPMGAEMEPGEVGVDPATFRANLRASGVEVVVVVRQPHPGRMAGLPTQHAALEAAGGARLLYRDAAIAVWRLGA
jgi:hypothetical protein